MMPDLGDYAGAVLSAYGVSIVLLVAIVVLSWVQSRSVRRQLDAIEDREDG
jgi:heme exporter protein D